MGVGLKYERIHVCMQLFDCLRSMRAAGASNYTYAGEVFKKFLKNQWKI